MASEAEGRGGPSVWMVALAAVAAGILLGLALAVLANDDDPEEGASGDPTLTESGSTDPTPPSTATTSLGTPATPSPTEAETRALGVYYLSEQAEGEWWLYREFRSVTIPDQRPIAAAVSAMFTLRPLDPDYESPWPAGSAVISTTRSGDTATIDLAAAAQGRQAPAAIAELAVQQLVHTATAADPTASRIRILVDGVELTDLWGQDVGPQPFARAPQAEVIAPVWIIEPEEGKTVPRPFTVRGTADVFEATVSYEVLDDEGSAIDDGSVTASTGTGGRGEWSIDLTLEPGTYVLRFYTLAEDGQPSGVDTKTVRVR